jgi:hypothetical protein
VYYVVPAEMNYEDSKGNQHTIRYKTALELSDYDETVGKMREFA